MTTYTCPKCKHHWVMGPTRDMQERECSFCLQEKLDLWIECGDNIMEVAVGRRAPLSDSDVIGVIQGLRRDATELAILKDDRRFRAPNDELQKRVDAWMERAAAAEENLGYTEEDP